MANKKRSAISIIKARQDKAGHLLEQAYDEIDARIKLLAMDIDALAMALKQEGFEIRQLRCLEASKKIWAAAAVIHPGDKSNG